MLDEKIETRSQLADGFATPPPVTPAAETPAVTVEDPQPESPGILTRLARAIDRAISANPKRTGHAQVCWMLLDTSGYGKAILTDKDRAFLTEKLKLYRKNVDLMMSHSHDSIYADWLLHCSEMQPKVHDDTISSAIPKTREEFTSEAELRLDVAKANLRTIYKECYPICSSVAGKFIYIAEKKLAQKLQYEKDGHEAYGLPFKPSAIIIACHKAIEFAKTRVVFNEYGEASPEQMLPYIDFD